MVWGIIAVILFVLILVFLAYSKKSENEKTERFNSFIENVKQIQDYSKTRIVSKREVLQTMLPYKPTVLNNEKYKKIVKLFGDDYLLFTAFNVSSSRSGFTVTTTTSSIWIAFYFKRDVLINIVNITDYLEK